MQQCNVALWSVKQSSFHSDEVINDKPLFWPSVTQTSLFTLHLRSALKLPARLCTPAVQLSVPSESRCHLSDLLSQLCFGLSLLSPSRLPSLPLMSQEKNLEWFPRMRAMSLVSSEGDNEQNEMRSLQEKLDNTVTLVAQLSGQLAELKEQVKCCYRQRFMLRWETALL